MNPCEDLDSWVWRLVRRIDADCMCCTVGRALVIGGLAGAVTVLIVQSIARLL